jgi:hypothetical protein
MIVNRARSSFKPTYLATVANALLLKLASGPIINRYGLAHHTTTAAFTRLAAGVPFQSFWWKFGAINNIIEGIIEMILF